MHYFSAGAFAKVLFKETCKIFFGGTFAEFSRDIWNACTPFWATSLENVMLEEARFLKFYIHVFKYFWRNIQTIMYWYIDDMSYYNLTHFRQKTGFAEFLRLISPKNWQRIPDGTSVGLSNGISEIFLAMSWSSFMVIFIETFSSEVQSKSKRKGETRDFYHSEKQETLDHYTNSMICIRNNHCTFYIFIHFLRHNFVHKCNNKRQTLQVLFHVILCYESVLCCKRPNASGRNAGQYETNRFEFP